MDAGALVDGDAVSGGVQGLALGAVASLHALAPAFRVGGDVVTRPGARVPAHLVHLTPAAVDTCSITSHITFYATIHFILFVTMGCVYLLVDGKSQSINRDSIWYKMFYKITKPKVSCCSCWHKLPCGQSVNDGAGCSDIVAHFHLHLGALDWNAFNQWHDSITVHQSLKPQRLWKCVKQLMNARFLPSMRPRFVIARERRIDSPYNLDIPPIISPIRRLIDEQWWIVGSSRLKCCRHWSNRQLGSDWIVEGSPLDGWMDGCMDAWMESITNLIQASDLGPQPSKLIAGGWCQPGSVVAINNNIFLFFFVSLLLSFFNGSIVKEESIRPTLLRAAGHRWGVQQSKPPGARVREAQSIG